MATIKNQEHQYNGDLEAGETVALYVNGQKFKEYTVGTGNTAKVVFNYQETAP
jgi:hypothetical protein